MRVLVVSEDHDERRRAVSALALLGDPEVVQVSSVDEFRAQVLEGADAFDVLVIDGDLRPRGGFAALYDLRARSTLTGAAPVPSVVLTARPQDTWLAAWAGANDVLPKPVDPFALAGRVAALEGAEPPPYGASGAASAQVAAATSSHR